MFVGVKGLTMNDRREFLTSCAGALAAASLPFRNLASGEERSDTALTLPSVAQIRSRSAEMWKLTDLINNYRRKHGLSQIPLSPKLTAVAALHAKDLAENRPYERHGSLHSWSDDVRWTGGAFRKTDKKTHPIMWDKPKEITGYDGYGFEVCAMQVRDLDQALSEWLASQTHADVLLNRNLWADKRWRWKALGAVFHRGYACAWFGDQPDA